MLLIGSGLFLTQFVGVSTKYKPIVGWHSIIAPAAPALSGDITSTISPTAIWTPSTYEGDGWVSDPITATPIVGYLQLSNELTSNPVNYFGMIGDNFSSIGATYSLQYYDDAEEEWFDFDGFEPVTPTSIKLRFHYFEPFQADGWRIKITHPGGTGIVFKIAHVKLGSALVLEKAMLVGLHSPNLHFEVEKSTRRGSKGKFLGNVVKSFHNKYEIRQPNNNPDFVRIYVMPFLKHMEGILETGTSLTGYGAQGSCFYAWRWDQYPEEVVYCHSPDAVSWPINQRSNGMMEWGLNGTAEI